MKKNKIFSLLLSSLLLLTSCQPKADDSSEVSASASQTAFSSSEESVLASSAQSEASSSASLQASSEESVSEVTYPITLTDQMGRTVTIEKRPQRIVSGYYISTSALIGLGLEDQLVGIEAKADKRPIYSLSAESLLDLPDVGSLKEFNLEATASLAPDLVILAAKQKENVEALTSLSIPVLVVNPETQKDLEEMLSLLGMATNTSARAEALTAFYEETKAELQTLLAHTEAPSVYLAGNSSFLNTAGDAMFQSDMIQQAGGRNVASEITDEYWAEISYEQLLAWNPEVIILASDAAYTVEDVLNDENLSQMDAVINQRVYQIPGDAEAWDSPVPSSILGSGWLASLLHPGQVTPEWFEEKASSFYHTFYDFSY